MRAEIQLSPGSSHNYHKSQDCSAILTSHLILFKNHTVLTSETFCSKNTPRSVPANGIGRIHEGELSGWAGRRHSYSHQPDQTFLIPDLPLHQHRPEICGRDLLPARNPLSPKPTSGILVESASLYIKTMIERQGQNRQDSEKPKVEFH